MASSTKLTGVIPPVVTPLRDNRSLDLASYERVINRLIDAGVDGLFILGSTSEVAFCTNDMRDQVVAEAVRIVGGRVPVLAGVIEMQTARVIERIKAAQDCGVDGVVATAPFYAVTHLPQIRKHFELLGDAAQVPVYAYDIPVCVHTKLDPDMLVALGSAGVIAGVKDSSNDDISFRRLALRNREAGGPLVLYTGHEFVVDGAYLSGAHGCVPGLANVDPAGYVRLHRACRDGDWDAARAEQDRLAQLMEIALSPSEMTGWGAGVGAFKTALMLQGIISTNQVPEPFDALTGADVDAIKMILDRCGPRE
jgi:4-hydroxy-tetrahydrodipicolinate synthase